MPIAVILTVGGSSLNGYVFEVSVIGPRSAHSSSFALAMPTPLIFITTERWFRPRRCATGGLFPIVMRPDQRGYIDKYGYVDKSGQYKINRQFDTATPFSDEGIAGVRVGDRWGGIDTSGKLVINPQFNRNSLGGVVVRLVAHILARDIGRVTFSEGLAPVKIGDKSGYIDRSDRFVLNPNLILRCRS